MAKNVVFTSKLRHERNYMTKFAFSRKLMTMLVVPENLNKKIIRFRRNGSIFLFFIRFLIFCGDMSMYLIKN